MNLMVPPELADGGYWYVLPVTVDPATGERSPGDIPGVGWCAWYHGDLVVIRTPKPVDGIASGASGAVSTVLNGAGYSGKPYGRVGGR